MRRALPIIPVGVLLVSLAACGTAKNGDARPAGTAQPGGAASAATTTAAVKVSCETLGQVYNKHMASFAEALTQTIGGSPATQTTRRQRAQESLKSFATAVRSATQTSDDQALRADGKRTADQLQAKAGDTAFFTGIRTGKDVSAALGPTLSGWLAPVRKHCS